MEPLTLPDISFRLLTSTDVEAALTVHEMAAGRLTNDMVRRESRDDLCQQINDGFVIGAVAKEDGALVAYGALAVLAESTGELAELLELDDRDRSRFCVLDGVAVLPEWQRRGVHELLIRERLCYARDLARDLVGVTVSPRNTRSLQNLLASNFRIARGGMLYGGFERLVLLRDMRWMQNQFVGVQTAIADNFKQSLDAIRKGLFGFSLTWNDHGEAVIQYGRERQPG
jgi:GNAT superfamily N-acetyltransferase